MGPREFCIDEYTDYLVYSGLAERERDPKLKGILERLAQMEKKHYEFWLRYCPECEGRYRRSSLLLSKLMRRLLGLTFTLKFLERHEEEVIAGYRAYLEKVDSDDVEKLREIIRDEEEHEKALMSEVHERIVDYLGSITLGLSDALIELVGVLAGTVAVFKSSFIAGITGLIVGVSASISMAAAAYLQAKNEHKTSPRLSAIFTGISYVLTVILLILPFFLLNIPLQSLTFSILIAVAIVISTSYYTAVIFDRKFVTTFLETAALTLGIGFGVYAFGEAIRLITGINVAV